MQEPRLRWGRGAPRGRSTNARRPRSRSLSPAARSRRARLPLASDHGEADLLLGDRRRVLGSDLSFVEDEDPVGEREDLVELEGDEEDRAPFIAFLHEPP